MNGFTNIQKGLKLWGQTCNFKIMGPKSPYLESWEPKSYITLGSQKYQFMSALRWLTSREFINLQKGLKFGTKSAILKI